MNVLATNLSAWAGAGWGLAGGLCVEALWLHTQIRGAKGHWSWRRPIPQGPTAYLISVVARVGVGGLVAAAAAGSGRVSNALIAFGLGVAAPLAVEKLAQVVPLTGHLPSKPDPRAAITEPSPQAVTAEASPQTVTAEPSPRAATAEPGPQAIPAEQNPPAAITEPSPCADAAERDRPAVITGPRVSAGPAERNRPTVIAEEVGDAG
jgi:hypothetical protein